MRTKIKKKVHPAHKKHKSKIAAAKEKEPSLNEKMMNLDLLPKTKRMSLFKKHKARDVKAEIFELKQASKKLKKKTAADRVEKKNVLSFSLNEKIN